MKNEKVKELWDKMVQIKLEKVISEQENETEDNVEDTQEENNENVNMIDVLSKLLNSRNQVHIFHLQTNSQSSYAEHIALGGYYEEIGGLVDVIIESYQGKYDILKGYKSNEYVDYDGSEQLISYFKELASDVEGLHKSVKESYIQNQIDTVEELIYSTLYKLRFLK